jgi:hypothetical protein
MPERLQKILAQAGYGVGAAVIPLWPMVSLLNSSESLGYQDPMMCQEWIGRNQEDIRSRETGVDPNRKEDGPRFTSGFVPIVE